MKRFNGSVLTEVSATISRSEFEHYLRGFRTKFAGIPIAPAVAAKQIKYALRVYMINVGVITTPTVDIDMVLFDATYDPFDASQDEGGVEVNLLVNPNQKNLDLGVKEWDKIIDELINVLVHEYTHNYQFYMRDYEQGRHLYPKEFNSAYTRSELLARHNLPKRKYTTKDYATDVQYYADPGELEAFATNAANELIQNLKDKQVILRLLQTYSRITNHQSPSFATYNTMFKPNSFVMKKFVTLVIKFIERFAQV